MLKRGKNPLFFIATGNFLTRLPLDMHNPHKSRYIMTKEVVITNEGNNNTNENHVTINFFLSLNEKQKVTIELRNNIVTLIS